MKLKTNILQDIKEDLIEKAWNATYQKVAQLVPLNVVVQIRREYMAKTWTSMPYMRSKTATTKISSVPLEAWIGYIYAQLCISVVLYKLTEK